MVSHWDLKMFPWDRRTPRFYPPGEHPAMAETYAFLRKTERIRELCEEDPEFHAAVRYLRERVAAFEETESELKVRAYERSREG